MTASASFPGVCFLSIVVSPWLFAATITVDPSGGGGFTAIQPALDAAADGDTVLVKAGEYVITEPLRFNRLHDPSNPASPLLKDLVLRAEGGAERTVLRGAEGIDSVVSFDGESWRSALDGFTVTGGGYGIRGSQSLEGMPFGSATILRCIVRECRSSGIFSHGGLIFASAITGNGGQGVECSAAGSLVVSCRISGNNRGLGVSDAGANPIVLHSSISGNLGHGIYGDETSSVRLVGSRLEDNTGVAMVCDHSGGSFTNCVISSNGGGVSVSPESGVSLMNCTLTGNQGDAIGIEWDGSEGGCRLTNCIVWNDTLSGPDDPDEFLRAFEVSHSITAGPVLFPGEGNSNADPLFVGAEDYHLQAGSPAIDAGKATGAPTSDIEGRRRPCGGGIDMGAYEYGDCDGQVIVDNASPETVATGNWAPSGGSQPFGDGSVYAHETGSAFTFAPRVPRPGDYDVFLWWTGWPSRIRSVPVEVFSARGRTLIHVDQSVGGGRWNRIATLPFEEAGVIRVFATTGGSTCADAVRLTPHLAADIVLDNGQPGTSSKGSWVASGGTSPYGGGSLYSKQSGASYRFALNVTTPGSYRAWMWWSGFPSRPQSVRVDIEHGAGTSSLHVNQQSGAGRWNELGTWDFEAAAVLTIFAAGVGSTCADAVRLTGGSVGPPSPPYEKVIDNGESGTAAVGSWPISGAPNPYGTSSLYSKQAGATYRYSFEVPVLGEYEVFLWWTTFASRLSSVRVDLSPGTGEVKTVYVNQTTDGSRWNSLGTYLLTGTATVTLRSGGVGSTCADAARIVRRDGVPPPLLEPFAYWRFDESSGRTAADMAGGHFGEILGATREAGRSGSALRLDGVNDYVAVSGTFRFEALTFAAWVNANTGVINNRRIITLHDDVDPSYYHFDLEANSARGTQVYAGTATVNDYDWTLTAGVWTHLAVTYDGAVGRIYWNGRLIEEGPLAVGPREGKIFIGGVPVPNHNAQAWSGLIDDVVVFDRALTADEVALLHVDGVH